METLTKNLEAAFSAASRLPEDAQDQLAVAILEELAADERWDELLASSHPALERLAEEALDEYRAGRTEELDPGSL